MICDTEGNIWLGSVNKGISILNPRSGKITNYQHNPSNAVSLPSNSVWSFCQTKDQVMWIGTHGGGLSYFDAANQTFHHFQHDPNNPKSISNNKIIRILEDNQGMLWVGTAGNGVDRFNRETNSFEHFDIDATKAGSLSNQYVLSIYQDKKGTIWIGTASGLNKYIPESNSFTSYKESDGFPNDMIYGMLEDSDGNLWISTNEGLVKFNPTSETITHYTEADGLQSNEFNFGAYYQNESGEMFLGGINGFNIFRPEEIKKNNYIPPVVLTDFQLFNKAVSIDSSSFLKTHINLAESITLSYKESVLFFEFAALNYTNSKSNEYAYKLDGFDDEWNYIGNRRTATYTNVPPGEYTFRVKGTNNDKVWNEEGHALKLIITPPLWQELWFQIVIGLCLLSIAYGLYRSKIKSIKAKSGELEELVTARTSEILRKNEEVERAYNNIQQLNQIGYQITSTFSVEKILEISYDSVNQLLDAACFGIGIFNEERQVLEFPMFIERGERLGYSYDIVDAENLLSGWCFINQKPIMINDIDTEYSQYLANKPAPVVGDLPQSVIYIPLSIPTKKIGVMTIQTFEKNAYNDFQLSLMEGLALYIATAIENANAYTFIEQQGEVLKKANTAIHSSIRYAKRIQNAILPPTSVINGIVAESFIFYKPRDIVSGDFYWFASSENKRFIAAVDCTGHGVPGGFMSMIGNQLLNEIVFRRGISRPDLILDALNTGIVATLRQDRNAMRDGMDLSLCVIDYEEKKIEFAGANNPLFYVKDNTPHFVKGSKSGIGGSIAKKVKEFNLQEIPFDESATYFLYTDGYQDQFGGSEGRKFLGKNFRNFLYEHHQKSMDELGALLENQLTEWMRGKHRQIDDILVIGFRL